MKKIPILLIACLFVIAATRAQQPTMASNPYPKTISVNGSADMEIVPDEIFVNVTLTEYQKRGESKKDLETIKTQFKESCRLAGIPDSLISIAFYSGGSNYYYYYLRRRKNADFFSTITYQVKFRNSSTMDALVEKLDENSTRSFIIASVSHSKINEYKKQLKMKALLAAKERGIYLTEALGEKLGETVSISDPVEYRVSSIQPYYGGNPYSEVVIAGYGASSKNKSYDNMRSDGNELMPGAGEGGASDIDFKKIRLKFDVNVVFALK